ncbi:alpha/beta hydrolase family protein [Flavobacterium humi]|uniref:Alpha/beta hydrolase n=1 Tax=Flavobacterium humi TaxID=2562683 RepID=A0A4Z0LCI2_9FLAO|nr:dienelactone hydrolase family protein [Flavobacterium humi]TGD59599.1 alpha/beta hydrolase [Flavobacterium humi]
MKKIIIVMLLISKNYASSQKKPEDFGYRQLSFKFQDDKVDLIVISKKGEEKIPKPLFFFCQGSLPRPVVIYDEKGLFGVLPFDESPLLSCYHIIIVDKPGVPIIANANDLAPDFRYLKDFKKELPPKAYTDRNYLDYYVFRNNFILKQLYRERWVDKTELAVAGHSEGSSVAAKMASLNPKITKLIYSGGNPFGRIATLLEQSGNANEMLEYWKEVVQNENIINYEGGDTYKATYSFSMPQREHLIPLKIPVLITYGTEDPAAGYNDLFQIEVIRERKKNFKFIRYEGLEHNFFSPDAKGNSNQDTNWDVVARDWLTWLNNQ